MTETGNPRSDPLGLRGGRGLLPELARTPAHAGGRMRRHAVWPAL